jgi:EAL domain-containing protein (putative c-di-GMP-specific phosphodiesterase class I)
MATNCSMRRATIQLAHRLGKRVVAEGVADVIQGYAFSRPLSVQQLVPLLDGLALRQLNATVVVGASAA